PSFPARRSSDLRCPQSTPPVLEAGGSSPRQPRQPCSMRASLTVWSSSAHACTEAGRPAADKSMCPWMRLHLSLPSLARRLDVWSILLTRDMTIAEMLYLLLVIHLTFRI